MPIYSINGKTIYYSHVPKCGGSSVEHGLSKHAKPSLLDKQFLEHENPELPCSPQHIHLELLPQFHPLDQIDLAFAVVRDPVARIESEFRYRIGLAKPFRERSRRNVEGNEPEEFNAWVKDALASSRLNPFIYDNHIRPQHEFVSAEIKIFRLEDGITPVFQWLSDEIGVKIKPPLIRKLRSRKVPIDAAPETIELIKSFYSPDYDCFGYSIGSASGKT